MPTLPGNQGRNGRQDAAKETARVNTSCVVARGARAHVCVCVCGCGGGGGGGGGGHLRAVERARRLDHMQQ